MDYRFNLDPDTGLAHCEQHNISEREVIDILQRPVEKFRRRDGVLIANGQTMAGRYLRVIFREYSDEDYIFVITAYDLVGKAKQAYRRRHKRR